MLNKHTHIVQIILPFMLKESKPMLESFGVSKTKNETPKHKSKVLS
jgi:hypothetical protein